MIKKILILAGCLFSIAATDLDWMEVSDNSEATVYVNVIELKHQKFKGITSVGAWTKSTLKKTQSQAEIADGMPITEFRAMHWYQCRDKKISDPIDIAFYGENGEFLDSYSEESSVITFRNAIPDTIESGVYMTVCLTDFSNEFGKLQRKGNVSDYDYQKLEENYPYQIRVLKEINYLD